MQDQTSMPQEQQSGDALKALLLKMTKDMNFLGIVSIIYGAFSCISIIGAVIGVPIIITGIRLRESSDAYRAYIDSDDKGMMYRAVERLSSFFYIYKVITIIYIALFVLSIIVFFLVMAFAGVSFLDQLDTMQ